jgi:hypothetical protein
MDWARNTAASFGKKGPVTKPSESEASQPRRDFHFGPGDNW